MSIENQTDLIIGIVLMDDSGSKALSSLRTVFDIVRLAEIDVLPTFGVNNLTATRSWDEGSIFTLSFAVIWGPVVALYSGSPPSAQLFKNCHQSALCKIVKLFTIGCKQRPRNWQKTQHTGQSLRTHILCSYRLPTATRVQLQIKHLFVLNRHYVSFLLDE